MRLVLAGGQEPAFLRENPSGIDIPQLSPDGRFVAYRNWETGEPSLEVSAYPDMGGRRALARTESAMRWSRSEREIYYISSEPFTMMVVTYGPGEAFEVKGSRALFPCLPLGINPYDDFSVAADGSWFVFSRTDAGANGGGSFTVVENWFEEYRDK